MDDIGIMGGTFNPIHQRELIVAQCAKEQFKLGKVLFIPNGIPPHKKTDLLDKESRFEMVAAAVADNPDFEASRLEIDRPGVTWTIETLRQLKQQYGPTVRLNFIIGQDNIKVFEVYNESQEFFKLCRLLVSPRDLVKEGMLEEWRATLPGAEIDLIDCPADARSSTLIRKWIRAGKSVRYLVPEPVYKILVAKQHYQIEPQPAADPTQTAAAATSQTAQPTADSVEQPATAASSVTPIAAEAATTQPPKDPAANAADAVKAA